MLRLFALVFSFGLGFLSYAVLDKGKAATEILPPSVRSQVQGAVSLVLQKPHSMIVPALRNLAEKDTTLPKLKVEMRSLQEKLQEASRVRSGEGIPELAEP